MNTATHKYLCWLNQIRGLGRKRIFPLLQTAGESSLFSRTAPDGDCFPEPADWGEAARLLYTAPEPQFSFLCAEAIPSGKHAAQAAGLGTIGRHSLLITPELGSMVWLGCVLTELELEPDSLLEPVCDGCNLCVEACPVNALEGTEVAQKVCGGHAFGNNPVNGSWEISCHACRDVCPFCFSGEAPDGQARH